MGNKENEYPVPDLNRTRISITNELNGTHKNLSKRKSWTRSLRNSWRSYKTCLTRKHNMPSKNMKTPQIKKLEKTQKQLSELREDFKKHQSETNETIKNEIYEVKKTTEDMKEDLNRDIENLRKKNQKEILGIKSPCSQTKNTVEGNSSKLEQVEDRIVGLKEKNRY
jgi:chromosome segregation ATPase